MIFNLFFLSGDAKDVEENILDKFFEFQRKADIYYAYHPIAKYMVKSHFILIICFFYQRILFAVGKDTQRFHSKIDILNGWRTIFFPEKAQYIPTFNFSSFSY